jgi:hypothetical protein
MKGDAFRLTVSPSGVSGTIRQLEARHDGKAMAETKQTKE